MSIIDVTRLAKALSPDAPCGPNLEDDLEFGELERAATWKAEQQYGDVIIPAEDPDWKEVRRAALSLLDRTRDLRVGVELTRALLALEGWPGFGEGMELLRRWIEEHWDAIHPQLDPEDNFDPTQRINSLAPLNDAATTLRMLRNTPLVRARGIGEFNLRDVAMAKGELPAPEGDTPDMTTIEAAFAACDLASLEANAAALKAAVGHAKAIEELILDRVGGMHACNWDELGMVLAQASKVLEEQLVRRGTGSTPQGAPSPGSQGESGAVAAAANEGVSAGAATSRGVFEIRSREDVGRAIDIICEYYQRHEPSSPVPLLLARAKRLATKTFLEIIRDLTPDALPQARSIGGVDADEETGY